MSGSLRRHKSSARPWSIMRLITPSLIRRSRNARKWVSDAPSPVRLSTAVSCTCLWSPVSPPSCPISGSEHVTPRFPRAGPDGHGSPPSTVLSGRYDFLIRSSFGLLVRQPAPCGCLLIRVRHRAPVAMQARRRAGIWIVHAGRPTPATSPTGKNRISQVSWHPLPRLCAGPRPRTTLRASTLTALPVLPPG